MKNKLLWVGSIVFFILLIDQILKIWVKSTFTVYDDPVHLLGSWFRLIYVENQGMAFGTTLGSSLWAKLSLSIFRIIAIIGISYYLFQQIKKNANLEFLIAVSLVLAGATGNLIDSMLYDFIFPYDPCMPFNQLIGSGNKIDCGFLGIIETKNTGFLFGNVVDMFQINLTWPKWIPWLGGGEVFPAIWNIADFSISVGVILMLIRQKKYFPKKK
ncbi:MAG: signal peptidase II [Flavobacteriia bacterium]|nr:signal peptidase II [Flavobacteriia bacterium]